MNRKHSKEHVNPASTVHPTLHSILLYSHSSQLPPRAERDNRLRPTPTCKLSLQR
ncbi:hypothetical protein M413DRAFT_444648 [Hebeloma cylindrosporum]|uniref:Uncharacterized protein n=1 Tax=Hebeloma cylindrosporum TaxID=76867 RepID=A0A0C3CF36_HEBCY|nr:hypothetical protein M413DRAFT_444648 [Hebeloma cylindrosporum h7]